MRRSALIIFMMMFIIITGCEKSTTSEFCGGDRPQVSLTWLKTKIEALTQSADCYSISRSTYRTQTVFIISNCQPNVNSVPILYNCEGMQLTLTDQEYQNLNFTGSIDLIWKNR